MYRALRPRFEKTGEVTLDKYSGEEIRWQRVSGWFELGIVRTMQEAKAKFGGSPILERVNPDRPSVH